MKVIIIFLLISLGVFSQEITAYGESILKLDKSPENNQLFARDKNDNADVYISGIFRDDTSWNNLILRVYKDGILCQELDPEFENEKFNFSSTIKAGLFQYKFELYHQTNNEEKLLFIADNIVCGDAYIITGQSIQMK